MSTVNANVSCLIRSVEERTEQYDVHIHGFFRKFLEQGSYNKVMMMKTEEYQSHVSEDNGILNSWHCRQSWVSVYALCSQLLQPELKDRPLISGNMIKPQLHVNLLQSSIMFLGWFFSCHECQAFLFFLLETFVGSLNVTAATHSMQNSGDHRSEHRNADKSEFAFHFSGATSTQTKPRE